MTSSIDVWKKWEGRVIEGKFPLRQWLGGSDRSAVFLTERNENGPQRAAIKIVSAQDISADNLSEEVQLSRWADSSKLSHPHLLRLFEFGRCQMDGGRFLYVVMEYAEEDLAQILPQRALSPEEVAEMLPPTARALDFLHRSGFTHGHIKPSNIMAVDNQLKISADGLRKIGEPSGRRGSAYDAPEAALSAASDMWSLGALLVAALTQYDLDVHGDVKGQIAIPLAVPEPFQEIARRCLRADPGQRCTVSDVLRRLTIPSSPAAPAVEKPIAEKSTKRWIVFAVVALLFLAAWLGRRSMVQRPAIPPAGVQSAPANIPAAQSPAPFAEKPAATGRNRGSVLRQVLPNVSRQAQGTIQGHVKVNVQVLVDDSGNVSQAKLTSPGPSQYFASRALEAALRWKFNPAQVDGQASSSVWILRFQFGRASTQVFPTETKP